MTDGGLSVFKEIHEFVSGQIKVLIVEDFLMFGTLSSEYWRIFRVECGVSSQGSIPEAALLKILQGTVKVCLEDVWTS